MVALPAGGARAVKATLSGVLVGLVMLLAGGPCLALQGVVTRVTDGDTLWVRPLGSGRPVKLRVQGIDAPERCQPWGEASRDRLRELVLGRSVRVVEGPHDDHGRRLGRLMRDDIDIGAQLVHEGLAWSYRWRSHPGPYAAEERAARAARRGLFADQAPMAPREFRRTHGPCT